VHGTVRGAARVGVTAATHNSDADAAGVTARVAEHAGARALATSVVKDFVEDRVWVSACVLARVVAHWGADDAARGFAGG